MTISFTKVSLPYGWLGNMSAHPVELDGVRWRTAEHAFQALRFPEGHFLREKLNNIPSPMGAKMAVKPYRTEFIFPPQSAEDLALMRVITLEKLLQNGLTNQLLTTGDELIVEDVTSRQRGSGPYWGAALRDGQWVGENWLGKIWMEHRSLLIHGC